LKKTVLDAKRIANNTVSFAKSYFVRERGICFALCRHAPSKTLCIYFLTEISKIQHRLLAIL